MTTEAGELDTRSRLLDAAERILVTEGYPAVTSRRVDREAGVQSKLVHYHFRTMDDLFVAMFRRRSEQGLQRFRELVDSGPTLRSIWEFSLDPIGYNLEFFVLAKHRPAVRAEIVATADRFRELQTEAIERVLTERAMDDWVTPELVVLTLNGLSQMWSMEDSLGITDGHDRALEGLESLLARFD